MVRGLWAQRLLWLMGGHTAFFPSSDFVVDSCTRDSLTEEIKGLSYCRVSCNDSTGSSGLLKLLSDFLLNWKPSNSSRFIPSICELATSMSDGHQVTELKDIWGKDNSLLSAWLNDLIEVS